LEGSVAALRDKEVRGEDVEALDGVAENCNRRDAGNVFEEPPGGGCLRDYPDVLEEHRGAVAGGRDATGPRKICAGRAAYDADEVAWRDTEVADVAAKKCVGPADNAKAGA
jgi:hypothetical protein